MKLEVRIGLPWALGEGQTVLVHSSQDLRDVTTYAGIHAMEQLRENRNSTDYEQVAISHATTTRNRFSHVFKPKLLGSPSTEFEEKDFIVSTLFYLMLEADHRGASSIVVPLLLEQQTPRLSNNEFTKLHLQAYIIYAQKGRPQHLKKVVFMPGAGMDQPFLDELLEFAGVFSEVDYYGTAAEQSVANSLRICTRCEKPRESFSLLVQGQDEPVCDYCLLRLEIRPLINNLSYLGKIRCELCKTIKDQAFHNCKLVCLTCAASQGLTEDSCVCLREAIRSH